MTPHPRIPDKTPFRGITNYANLTYRYHRSYGVDYHHQKQVRPLAGTGFTLVPIGGIAPRYFYRRFNACNRQALHLSIRSSRRAKSFFPSHQIVSLLAPATRTSPLGICLSLSNCVRAFPLHQPAQTCIVQVGCVTRVTFNPIAPASSQKSQLHFNLPFPVSSCRSPQQMPGQDMTRSQRHAKCTTS